MPNSPCFPHSRPPRKSTNAEPSSAAKRTPRAGQPGRASAQRIGGSAAGASRGDNQRGGMRPRRGSAQTSRSTQPRGTAQSRSTAQSLTGAQLRGGQPRRGGRGRIQQAGRRCGGFALCRGHQPALAAAGDRSSLRPAVLTPGVGRTERGAAPMPSRHTGPPPRPPPGGLSPPAAFPYIIAQLLKGSRPAWTSLRPSR